MPSRFSAFGCDAFIHELTHVVLSVSLIELLRETLDKRITIKRNKYIWGPEEESWDGIPTETRLEVWKYEFSDGHLNLHFINEGEHLNYKAFAPKGVI